MSSPSAALPDARLQSNFPESADFQAQTADHGQPSFSVQKKCLSCLSRFRTGAEPFQRQAGHTLFCRKAEYGSFPASKLNRQAPCIQWTCFFVDVHPEIVLNAVDRCPKLVLNGGARKIETQSWTSSFLPRSISAPVCLNTAPPHKDVEFSVACDPPHSEMACSLWPLALFSAPGMFHA